MTWLCCFRGGSRVEVLRAVVGAEDAHHGAQQPERGAEPHQRHLRGAARDKSVRRCPPRTMKPLQPRIARCALSRGGFWGLEIVGNVPPCATTQPILHADRKLKHVGQLCGKDVTKFDGRHRMINGRPAWRSAKPERSCDIDFTCFRRQAPRRPHRVRVRGQGMKAYQSLVAHRQVAVALGIPAQPLRLAISRVPRGRRVLVQRRRGEAAHQRPEHRRHDQDALHAVHGVTQSRYAQETACQLGLAVWLCISGTAQLAGPVLTTELLVLVVIFLLFILSTSLPKSETILFISKFCLLSDFLFADKQLGGKRGPLLTDRPVTCADWPLLPYSESLHAQRELVPMWLPSSGGCQ